MAISVRERSGVRAEKRPSVREVCLIGAPRPSWSAGDRVTWSGRVYRVEASEPPGPAPGAAGYVHLADPG